MFAHSAATMISSFCWLLLSMLFYGCYYAVAVLVMFFACYCFNLMQFGICYDVSVVMAAVEELLFAFVYLLIVLLVKVGCLWKWLLSLLLCGAFERCWLFVCVL